MSKYLNKIEYSMLLLTFLLVMGNVNLSYAQEWRWLRIGEIQSFFSERGAEVEGEGEGLDPMTNWLAWPAQYGMEQTSVRMKSFWLGCENFYDTVEGKEKDVKVVGIGPRADEDWLNQIFIQEIKLIGKYPHPNVFVDDNIAGVISNYDEVDEIDENLPADRMIVIKFNTSIGLSVTKKILAFTHQEHDNYFIHDYTIKNTGIINKDGEVYAQDLQNVWLYYFYRYVFSGESLTGWSQGWGANTSCWGANTLNHHIGTDPLAENFKMRAFYSWGAPNRERPLEYEEDWGCPDQTDDGVMASVKYIGCATLHADKSPDNPIDDKYQPRTNSHISSDGPITHGPMSQYDEIYMRMRYDAMSSGHPEQTHYELVGDAYPQDFENAVVWNDGGGTSQGQGYGPYNIAYGDSIRIVFAEGASGINRAKNREVGDNWLQYYNGSGTPELMMPDGTIATDHNAYKRAWVETGVDSILKTYQNALDNFNSNYEIAQAAPQPPRQFTVTSGGNQIALEWADNAASEPGFDGYVIYRSEGTVANPKTVYRKIFECDASNAVHQYSDISAVRGFDYYYYIQTKVNRGGKPIRSGMFWTLTSFAANLQRPAGFALKWVRVVPNPYDIRNRALQFGDESQYDRIAFYELPPKCKVKVFTERGDLIWEKEHIDGSGDELWDSMTMSSQILVSGIYILYVEVTEDVIANEDFIALADMYDPQTKEKVITEGQVIFPKGEQVFTKGESVYRKFVVIR